ncbi:sigma-54-dependent transcriptional regulator [Luteitalea sp.]|jgi:DNA-binding NtrC family response regulator|uniref:sigma-54-dependent transcriptional regulator n=1 Tax=Luteitalea sp. TaxID=2004800 RepID=UPI0037C5E9CF
MPLPQKTLLIVDDDEGMRDTLTAILKREYRVITVATAEDGLSRLRQTRVDLMLLDVRLPGMGGLELLRQVRELHDEVEVIMISAITDVETAVQAMKLGAYHYITKEFDYDALRALVRNASERQDLRNRVESLTAQVQALDEEFVTGTSAAMKTVVSLVQKVAPLDTTVLITGESGTGKEMLARRIHGESDRRRGPFIAVNLAAIPSELVESTLFGHERGAFTGAVRQQLGKFELANGGTLFLDEIGDLRLDLQAKLLRAIQENEIERVGARHPLRVDIRLVVATNADLSEAVRSGRFREDLFYRINVIPVRLPALRDRMEDLEQLLEVFVRRYAIRFRKAVRGIEPSAFAVLQRYRWPGNIRELQNLAERMVAVCDKGEITEADLPLEVQLAALDAQQADATESLLDQAVAAFERSYLLKAIEKGDWNVAATARQLRLPLSTLKHRLSRLGLNDVTRRRRDS